MSLFQKNKYVPFLGENAGPGLTHGVQMNVSNSDFINFGPNVASNGRAFSFWFIPGTSSNSMGSTIETIISNFPNTSSSVNDFALYYRTGGFHFYKWSASGTTTASFQELGQSYIAGTPYFVTISVDSSRGIEMYVNGVKKSPANSGNNFVVFKSIGNTYISSLQDLAPPIRYYGGKVYGVSFWTLSKNLSDHIADMNRVFTGSETGLTAHYLFDEGSGASIQDMNANVLYNGTLNTSNVGGVTYINNTMRITI